MASFASSSFLHGLRRRPLAAGVSALFAVSASSAWAAPPAVTNCNDSGVGSLRYAVDPANGAVSGDTIDFSALTTGDPGCASSTITLTTGAIVVSQQNLTIKGNGLRGISIGQFTPNSRVITHSYPNAAGHLYFQDTEINNGQITGTGQVYGGCIATLGSLTLNDVEVRQCSATTTGLSTDTPQPLAWGGGVFAGATLEIYGHSLLDHNAVYATNTNVRAQGGCAMTSGAFDMSDSVVAVCSAVGPTGGGRVRGGALELKGSSVTITRSIIAKSNSTFIVGGVDLNNGSGGLATATISNSSIAYNDAGYLVGGLYANSDQFFLNNSTIVLNTAGNYTYTYNTHTYNAGVGVSILSIGGTFSLQSVIIANNAANGTQEDLAFGASTGLTFAASNNLVRAYRTDVTLPGGQGNLAPGTCPLLGSVRNNGGGTYTFAPQSGSPVIDSGNNAANEPYDQRGMGYARISGPSADIGSHEVQKADIIFYSAFETNCL